jgi:replicative DNA helicase
MELDFTTDVIEKLLLKRTLSDKNWLNTVSNIYDARWFKTPQMDILVNLVIKFYKKYDKIPTIQLLQMLSQKYAENHKDDNFSLKNANELIYEVTSMNLGIPDDVIDMNLKEFVRKNALTTSLMDNIDLLSMADGERDSDKYQKIVDKCLANFDKVQRITFSDNDLGLDYFSEKGMNDHWEFLRNPDAKIATGWSSIDHYTNGGFLKDGRMLALFMAQAGLGKSVFLSNLAVNFLMQNLSVVVISLEMSQDVYAQRFDAHISMQNINKLKDNEQTARSRITDFYTKYKDANLIIKEFPPRSINTSKIDAYIESLITAGKKVDAIIVDYLNLVLPNRQTDSMFKDGMAVSEELRSLSYKYKVPVISAVQSNSEGMNTEEIDMQNVSESRGIVHTTDALFAIYQTQEQREAGRLGFKVIKNRLGGLIGKKSSFIMNPETLVLRDMTFENNEDIPYAAPDSELSKLVSAMENCEETIFNM